MATTPHGGHTAQHHRHKTREVGEGHHHVQRSLHRRDSGGTEKKADDGNSCFAFTPFSFDSQGLDGSWCQF